MNAQSRRLLLPKPQWRARGGNENIHGISWLLRVRWVAGFGQLAVFGAAQHFLEQPLEWLPVVLISLSILFSNLILARPRVQRYGRQRIIVACVVLFDVCLLTVLLAAYGGHTNPFSVVYIVHVILAALLLGSTWSWTISAISSLCYVSLFFYYLPVPELSMHHYGSTGRFSLHLQGMLISFVLTASLVSWFFQHMRKEIDLRQHEIDRQHALEDRLAAVTLLAATAAHEMGTPLGSMRLIVDEMQSGLAGEMPVQFDSVRADLAVLSKELDRCAHSVRQLVHSSGEHLGEMPSVVSVTEIVNNISSTIAEQTGARVQGCEENGEVLAYLPREALTHVLYSLVKNAAEAVRDRPDGLVTISTSIRETDIALSVTDNGHGIAPENLKHMGEPFFSTKGTSGGMGLGVFLAQLFAKRLGGSLNIESSLTAGTSVRLHLPRTADWSPSS